MRALLATAWLLLIGCIGSASAQEIIVDNAPAGTQDAAGGRLYFGRWCTSTGADTYGAGSLTSCGPNLDTYRFTPTLPSAGRYQVYVWWRAQATNSANAPVVVVHAAGAATKTFDQRSGGGRWVLHGTYSFFAGARGQVKINDANGQASADAVRFVPAGAVTPPPSVEGAPSVFFLDVVSGPQSGGPSGLGVPIGIFGKGFGATRGTSKVTINGVEVARYLLWGSGNANNAALDMIVVQPGANVSAGPVVVNVGGKASNDEHTFRPSGGRVFYVAPSGSDGAVCSEAQPCASIQHTATNVMQAGDALLVRGGTVNDDEVWLRREYGHSGLAAQPKTIRNYPGETPLYARGVRPFILDADHITLAGLHVPSGKPVVVGYETSLGIRVINNAFRGAIGYDAIGTHGNDVLLAGNDCNVTGSSVGTQGHCYYISNGSNIRILYNTARGAPGYGVHIFDQRRSANDIQRVISDVLVEGNILNASPQRSGLIVAMADEGARGNYIDGVTIRNNIFAANNFAGIAVGGIVRNVRIYHNTFYRNGRQGVTVYDEASVNGVEIVNNLLDQSANTNCKSNCSWYASAHIQKGARAQSVVITSNFYTPGPATVLGGADSAASLGDPGFVNAAAGNYALNAASAAVDKGASLPSVKRDFSGRARPIGAKPDAGAFERP